MHGFVYLFNPSALFIRFPSPLFDKSPESGGGSSSLDTEAGGWLVHTCCLLTSLAGSPFCARPPGRGGRTARPRGTCTAPPGIRRPAWPGEPCLGICRSLPPPRLVQADPCIYGKDTRPHRSFGNSPPTAQAQVPGLAFESLQINDFSEALPRRPDSATSGPRVKPPGQPPSHPQAHCASGKLGDTLKSPD